MNRFLIIAALFAAASCRQNDVPLYNDTPALYFGEDYDSISHSFFFLPSGAVTDTLWIQVNVLGRLADVARPVALRQSNADGTLAARAGVHYVAFDAPSLQPFYSIPANAASVKIPVVFIRDASLDDSEVRLEIAVADNNCFRPGIAGKTAFVATTTARPTAPNNWNSLWRWYFGADWGPVKWRFIIDVTGIRDLKQWETMPDDLNYPSYLRNLVEQAFREYNRDNPDSPLVEADGTPVKFM
jgi:hypothetical protein